MKLYIEEALAQWEPRIDVHEIDITSPPDRREVLLVEIKYQIKDTYDERSIIYPFYITGEEPPG
jgi:phage baseplate assembly protein W